MDGGDDCIECERTQNIGGKLHDNGLGKVFLDVTAKNTTNKRKSWKIKFH